MMPQSKKPAVDMDGEQEVGRSYGWLIGLVGVVVAVVLAFFGMKMFDKVNRKNAEKSLRMIQVTGSKKAGGAGSDVAVVVVLRNQEQCRIGDGNAILLDVVAGGESEVLLAVEPIGVATRPSLATWRFTIKKLLADGSLEGTLKVPAFSGTYPVGFFICRDKDKKESCRDKPYDDGQVLYHTYAEESVIEHAADKELPQRVDAQLRPKTNEQVKAISAIDRMYFFQPGIAKDGALFVLPPLSKNDALRERLRFYGEKYFSKDKVKADDAMIKLSSLLKTVESRPVEPVDGKLRLVLTVRNPKCWSNPKWQERAP